MGCGQVVTGKFVQYLPQAVGFPSPIKPLLIPWNCYFQRSPARFMLIANCKIVSLQSVPSPEKYFLCILPGDFNQLEAPYAKHTSPQRHY